MDAFLQRRQTWGIVDDCSVFVWPEVSDFTTDELVEEIKVVAELLCCDQKKGSAHSLRYGGASMLAFFGSPQYLIEYFGG